MAKARLVSTKFWSDTWIVDELNPLDRYLFLYLLTNEKTNIVGVYELPLRTVANETGIEKDEVIRMMQRLDSRVLYIDGWVVFRKMIKHQNYKSPKIESAMARELSNVPSHVLQHIQMPDDLRKMMTEVYGIDMVSIPSHARNNNNNNNNNNNLTPTITITPTSVVASKPARPSVVPKERIDEMLELWKAEIGFEVGNEAGNRRAIASLIRQHEVDGVARLIAGVKLALDDQYAPRVSDFISLKRKQNDLKVWGRKRNMKSMSRVAVIS
jgi:hypothetical protein